MVVFLILLGVLVVFFFFCGDLPVIWQTFGHFDVLVFWPLVVVLVVVSFAFLGLLFIPGFA